MRHPACARKAQSTGQRNIWELQMHKQGGHVRYHCGDGNYYAEPVVS